MHYNELFFFFSQVVFLPTFLLTTKKIFDKELSLKGCIKYILLSPFFVYIYSILVFGIMAVTLPEKLVYDMAAFGDIFALLISFVAANIFAKVSETKKKTVAVFIYNTFYMVGMVFNLVYSSLLTCIIFSAVIPAIVSFLFYKTITVTLARIESSLTKFQPMMMLLPIIAELMLVMRFLLNIVSNTDVSLIKYDHALSVYSTAFGYIMIAFVFVSSKMISKYVEQIQIISEQKEQLVSEITRNERLSLDMLKALVGTIEAKDEYTNGHSHRVAKYSKMLAEKLELSEKDVDEIYKMALLHDIGKIGIPDDIIMKSGKLTDREYEIIKQHPVKGAEILSEIKDMPNLYIGARFHHERWDGKGYPSGARGEEIPLQARIISVADAYDAMTSKRSYRDAMSQQQVKSEIKKGIDSQFYPEAAEAMLSIISKDKGFTFKQ